MNTERLYLVDHVATQLPNHVELTQFTDTSVTLTHFLDVGTLETTASVENPNGNQSGDVTVFQLVKDAYSDPNVRLAEYLGYQSHDDGTVEVRTLDGNAEVWAGFGRNLPEAVLVNLAGIQQKGE